MGKMFDKATERSSLSKAWRHIRENGMSSSSSETRVEVARFDVDANLRINRIQSLLRSHKFRFDPQVGVLKRKRGSDKKRGIVMASVQNRIVERALLDRLQSDSKFVQEINSLPTSVGGVPHRSVPHGLKIIDDAIQDGKTSFVRSDITGFFDNIPRDKVLKRLSSEIDDAKFLQVLEEATTVTLGNEITLGEDRRLFPTDVHGVAQGSPLSPLFGNILLNEFDHRMNGRGIVCVRFIDDFMLLGDSPSQVAKAFSSANMLISGLGLRCHDPFLSSADAAKSAFGDVRDGVEFLGYHIERGLYQPSNKARSRLLQMIDDHLGVGRSCINECLKCQSSFAGRQRYVQTLDVVDRVLRGWANAFAYSNYPSTMNDLDKKVDKRLARFRSWYRRKAENLDWRDRRRAGGVCLISDVESKSLNEVPIVIGPGAKRFRRSKNTVTISTDGAVLGSGRRKGKDQGPGGWGFVVHETEEQVSGMCPRTTNNRMELQAVIEALKCVPKGRSVEIQTDSQYVEQGAGGEGTVKSNIDLWQDYKKQNSERAIKVVWVKGHSGDKYNEIADQLAHEAAKQAATSGDSTDSS